jgi:hypothetical protein
MMATRKAVLNKDVIGDYLAGGGFGLDSNLGDGMNANNLGANMTKATKEKVL